MKLSFLLLLMNAMLQKY